MSDTPWTTAVSVVIPVRNEADHLPRCLTALARQTYPLARLTVLVVDGESSDGSAAIARAHAGPLTLSVLPNPARMTPAGLNVGV